MYIYNVLNNAVSTYKIHNKLKTILSKYMHIQRYHHELNGCN